MFYYYFRQKTIQFEKLKLHLKDLLGEAEEEKHTLGKFKNEINLLLQEKMAHVEELRLIHTDINTVRIKSSQLFDSFSLPCFLVLFIVAQYLFNSYKQL